MCVLLITGLLGILFDGWALVSQFNHTSWVTAVTQTDRPKSVRNRCVIEVFGGVFYVVTMLSGFYCGCRGFCHRTESDVFLCFDGQTTNTIHKCIIVLLLYSYFSTGPVHQNLFKLTLAGNNIILHYGTRVRLHYSFIVIIKLQYLVCIFSCLCHGYWILDHHK